MFATNGPRRRFKRLVNGPATINPIAGSRALNDVSRRCESVRQYHGFSFVYDNSIVAFVPSLRKSGIPNTVVWSIRSIVIHALNCMARARARTHVGIEGFKHTPPVTYGNASPPVSMIEFVVRFFASSMHGNPASKFWGLTHAVSEANTPQVVACQATTGLGVAAVQRIGVRYGLLSAIALAVPHRLHALVRSTRKHKKACEALPSQISDARRSWIDTGTFSMQTAARLDMAFPKVSTKRNNGAPTITLTVPSRTIGTWGLGDNQQSLKALTHQTNGCRRHAQFSLNMTSRHLAQPIGGVNSCHDE